MIPVTNKNLWALAASLSVALLFALGCGASAQPAASAPPVTGNQVGDQLNPFTLRLADGATVQSTDLVGQKKPTFIMFFKVP